MDLRLAAASDAAQIVEIYAPIVETTPISFEEVAPSVAEMRERIAETLRTFPWLVAERDGAVAGYVYATQFRARAAYRWSVEVTAYVRESARGAGIGSTLYRALFRVLAAQGYRNAFAGITLPNDPSVALHRAVGFTPVGVYHRAGYKFGAWHDTGWYERALETSDEAPREPIPLPELDATLLEFAVNPSGPHAHERLVAILGEPVLTQTAATADDGRTMTILIFACGCSAFSDRDGFSRAPCARHGAPEEIRFSDRRCGVAALHQLDSEAIEVLAALIATQFEIERDANGCVDATLDQRLIADRPNAVRQLVDAGLLTVEADDRPRLLFFTCFDAATGEWY